MKKKYNVLPYCIKHKLHHGQKWPSCKLQGDLFVRHGVENLSLPSGSRLTLQVYGPLHAKDIQLIYFMMKKVMHTPSWFVM